VKHSLFTLSILLEVSLFRRKLSRKHEKPQCTSGAGMITADFSIEDALDAAAREFNAELEHSQSARSARCVGARRDGSSVSISEYMHDEWRPHPKSNECFPVALHYSQAGAASYDAAQAAVGLQPAASGSHAAALMVKPLSCPLPCGSPNPYIGTCSTMPDEAMVALIHVAEQSMRLNNDGNNTEIAGPAAEQIVHGERLGTKLMADDAVFIYQQKRVKTSRMAEQLGREYNITAKAVRDIWRRRTWRKATREHCSDGDDDIDATESAGMHV